MANLFQKFYFLSRTEKKLFVEAFCLSVYARIIIKILPFKWYEKSLGEKNKNESEIDFQDKERLILVKRAVRRAAKYSWWRNKCFEQSFTTWLMLKRRKIHYTIFFGLNSEEKKLTAHVWIKTGDFYFVNKGNINFTTVLTYSN
jgi:hypothetical protein